MECGYALVTEGTKAHERWLLLTRVTASAGATNTFVYTAWPMSAMPGAGFSAVAFG